MLRRVRFSSQPEPVFGDERDGTGSESGGRANDDPERHVLPNRDGHREGEVVAEVHVRQDLSRPQAYSRLSGTSVVLLIRSIAKLELTSLNSTTSINFL